jgi:hypothetical protein
MVHTLFQQYTNQFVPPYGAALATEFQAVFLSFRSPYSSTLLCIQNNTPLYSVSTQVRSAFRVYGSTLLILHFVFSSFHAPNIPSFLRI